MCVRVGRKDHPAETDLKSIRQCQAESVLELPVWWLRVRL